MSSFLDNSQPSVVNGISGKDRIHSNALSAKYIVIACNWYQHALIIQISACFHNTDECQISHSSTYIAGSPINQYVDPDERCRRRLPEDHWWRHRRVQHGAGEHEPDSHPDLPQHRAETQAPSADRHCQEKRHTHRNVLRQLGNSCVLYSIRYLLVKSMRHNSNGPFWQALWRKAPYSAQPTSTTR